MGLWRTTLTLLLIWNPVVYCYWYKLEEIMREMKVTQKMIKKLDERSASLQNSMAQQNWLQQLPSVNDGLPQLNKRLADVEASVKTIMSQMQSTNTRLENTEETLSAIKKSIESLSTTVTTSVAAISSSTDQINRRFDNTDHILNNAQGERKLNLNKDTMRTMCIGMAAEDNSFEHQVSETDKLLKKYDHKLNTYNDTVDEVKNDLVKLNGRLDRIDEACHKNVSNVIERQEEKILKIEQFLSGADNTLKNLPRLSDSLYLLNLTLEAVENIGQNITEIRNNYLTKLTTGVSDVNNSLININRNIPSLNNTNTMGDQAYYDIMQNFGTVFLEIQALSKKGSMILQTASKIDVVHETNFLEIKDLMNRKLHQSNNKLNNSMTEFDPLTVGNQISKLSAIANKIESEMERLSCDIIEIYDVVVNNAPLDKAMMAGVAEDLP